MAATKENVDGLKDKIAELEEMIEAKHATAFAGQAYVTSRIKIYDEMDLIGKTKLADETIPNIMDEQNEQNTRLQNLEDQVENVKASIEIYAKEIKDLDELNKKHTKAIKDEVGLFRQSVKSGVEEDLAKFDTKIQSISEATDAGLRDTVDKMQTDMNDTNTILDTHGIQPSAQPGAGEPPGLLGTSLGKGSEDLEGQFDAIREAISELEGGLQGRIRAT